MVNPADDEAFLRVVNVPRRGIGDTSLDLLVRTATQWRMPLAAAAAVADRIPELRPNLREALRAVAALLAGLREHWGQADPATVLEKVIAATGYERYLADEGAEGVDRLENVQELIAGAAEWAEVAVAGNGAGGDEPATLLERYLTQVALVTPADGGADAPGGVS